MWGYVPAMTRQEAVTQRHLTLMAQRIGAAGGFRLSVKADASFEEVASSLEAMASSNQGEWSRDVDKAARLSSMALRVVGLYEDSQADSSGYGLDSSEGAEGPETPTPTTWAETLFVTTHHGEQTSLWGGCSTTDAALSEADTELLHTREAEEALKSSDVTQWRSKGGVHEASSFFRALLQDSSLNMWSELRICPTKVVACYKAYAGRYLTGLHTVGGLQPPHYRDPLRRG